MVADPVNQYQKL